MYTKEKEKPAPSTQIDLKENLCWPRQRPRGVLSKTIQSKNYDNEYDEFNMSLKIHAGYWLGLWDFNTRN